LALLEAVPCVCCDPIACLVRWTTLLLVGPVNSIQTLKVFQTVALVFGGLIMMSYCFVNVGGWGTVPVFEQKTPTLEDVKRIHDVAGD
jgi:hypothetical protein